LDKNVINFYYLSLLAVTLGSRVRGESSEAESRTNGARISEDDFKCRMSGIFKFRMLKQTSNIGFVV